MELKRAKELVADMYSVGIDKVKIVNKDEVLQALTRNDLERLVNKGSIVILKKNYQSRGRARILRLKKKKGRRRGHGSRKGRRAPNKKKLWMIRIRALRKYLKSLKDRLDPKDYRHLYLMAKGGYFRSKAHLNIYLRDHRLLKE